MSFNEKEEVYTKLKYVIQLIRLIVLIVVFAACVQIVLDERFQENKVIFFLFIAAGFYIIYLLIGNIKYLLKERKK